MLQIDALSYAELRRAIELGYCPTISQMVREEGYTLRRWFCGLPSATPYCQAGIMYGENEGIPAFRFYDKAERRVITCNAPSGVQYIRDRIDAPGALAGGSSYVNLLDGDAETVAFTVATRERMSVFRRLGGWRMALLILLHPIRMARMMVQAALEWLREEYERARRASSGGKRTHSEGLFPFVRILSNVIVRELQTMAILLDVYLGVPIIYSTFMQYDELGHHFGPSSFQALRDLRRTDARIREIRRMIESLGGAPVRHGDPVGPRHDAVVELSRAVRRDARQDGRAHSRGRRGATRRTPLRSTRELRGDVGVRRHGRAGRRSAAQVTPPTQPRSRQTLLPASATGCAASTDCAS